MTESPRPHAGLKTVTWGVGGGCKGEDQRLRRSHATFEGQKKSTMAETRGGSARVPGSRIRKVAGDWGWDFSVIAGPTGRF